MPLFRTSVALWQGGGRGCLQNVYAYLHEGGQNRQIPVYVVHVRPLLKAIVRRETTCCCSTAVVPPMAHSCQSNGIKVIFLKWKSCLGCCKSFLYDTRLKRVAQIYTRYNNITENHYFLWIWENQTCNRWPLKTTKILIVFKNI